MGAQLTENHLGTTPVAPSQLNANVGPLAAEHLSIQSRLEMGPSPKSKPSPPRRHPVGAQAVQTTERPPCGCPDCADHVGATPWASILFQTLIRLKTT